MKVVIWLSVLTEHQLHTFKSLGSLLPSDIQYVIGSSVLPEREKQGWPEMDVGGLQVCKLPEKAWFSFSKDILQKFPDAIHLFGGLWADRRMFFSLLYAQHMGFHTALIMEPYALGVVSCFKPRPNLIDKLKSILRPVLYGTLGKVIVDRSMANFLISSKAVEQFRRIGIDSGRIFPFGYFVPLLEEDQCVSVKKKYGLNLAFIGSLIHVKGLDVLLAAFSKSRLEGNDVWLDVYGPGDSAIINSDGVNYCGVIPFGRAQSVLKSYDLLILPSRHDGWGVVVNEALLQGVPALVSTECGSKTLIQSSGAGAVFLANDPSGLSDLINLLCRSPSVLLDWRSAANKYRKTLSPDVAGNYLYQCLQYSMTGEGSKPASPWYLDTESANGH